MIKKLFLLTIICCACVVAAAAQSVGTWHHVNSYGGAPSKIIDTPHKVFAVSQSRLTVYDKDYDELSVYSKENMLTDSKIRDIYYNFDKNYVLAVYENGNIDMVYDDGRVVNMPEIRNMELNADKSIRNVWFKDNRIYLSCNFGLVVMDDEKHNVIESVMWTNPLIAAFVIGDQLIVCDSGYGVYKSPANIKHYSLSQFSMFDRVGHDAIAMIDNRRYYSVEWGSLFLYTINENYDGYSRQYFPVTGITGKFNQLKSGGYFIYGSDVMAFCDNDGNVTTYPLNEDLAGLPLTSYEGSGHLWAANEYGISEYSYNQETGETTVLKKDYRPMGLSCGSVGHISKGAKGIYFLSPSPSNPYVINENTRSFIDYQPYGALGYENIYPKDLPHNNNSFPSPKNLMGGNYRLTEIPNEPGNFLIGNFFEGIYKMNTKGEVLGKYDCTNSSLASRAGGYVNGATAQAFDRDGNLWVMDFNDAPLPFFHMLPADKFKAGKTDVSDWNSIVMSDYYRFKDGGMLICKKSNMIFLGGMYGIVGYDTKGTWSNLSDDEYSYRIKLTDQDGLGLESYYYIPMVEDHNGRVWIGHDGGVIEITNPSTFNRADFHINRIKVPRNDGTSLADYLLDGMRVTCIAVDASNRKWLGTNISGLYLVNENGSEVLAHFTTENSDIPSDCVYSVECDDNSNRVYVGTDVGLAIYAADAAPPAEDFSEVYAYPNPVRPEYTGLITVTGLMDNSLVKITDAAGNVFYSGRSEGGMITWDGCNSSGQRVKTGVYFVYASQSDGSQSSGAVTKILVVN
ncbi:MAG: hypothetical protein K2M65_03895 [Muribaculaceae bacterium]|nr:hypothetical protein [Muribaculaceae bacterium]